MSIDDRLVHRAYVLVESGVPTDEAVEELVTVAHGSTSFLEAARDRAASYQPTDITAVDEALEIAGFEVELSQLAERRHEEIADLIERAIRCVS